MPINRDNEQFDPKEVMLSSTTSANAPLVFEQIKTDLYALKQAYRKGDLTSNSILAYTTHLRMLTSQYVASTKPQGFILAVLSFLTASPSHTQWLNLMSDIDQWRKELQKVEGGVEPQINKSNQIHAKLLLLPTKNLLQIIYQAN